MNPIRIKKELAIFYVPEMKKEEIKMRRIIKNGKVVESKLVKLVEDVYEYFNGKINPTNNSQKLLIVKTEWDETTCRDIGFAGYGTVAIDIGLFMTPVYVNGIINNLKITSEKRIESLIQSDVICVVAHELSHMNQDIIGYTRLENDLLVRDVECMEVANECNTINFVAANKASIEKDLDTKIDVSVHVLTNSVYRIPSSPRITFGGIYKPIESKLDIFNRILIDFTGKNFNETKKYCEENDIYGVLVKFEDTYYDLFNEEAFVSFDALFTFSFKEFNSKYYTEERFGKKMMIIDITEVGECNDGSKVKFNFLNAAA